MIAFEHKQDWLLASVYGEFTLADFKQFEDQVVYRLDFQGRVNLLLDLRDMARYTLDVAWEELRFGREHPFVFEKIAVVTGDAAVGTLAWLANLFTSAQILNFDQPGEAEAWLSA